MAQTLLRVGVALAASPERGVPLSADLARIAKTVFGFESFRPGQEPALRALLAGHDVLAVLPTAGGKSAIYQIAGAALAGATVVVSPLIALQRDQAEKLAESDSGGAAIVNSTIGLAVRREAFAELVGDSLEFIFLAPEQLGRPEVLDKLLEAKPSLFVIDEAHCISEWGHDFRPDYLRLGGIIEALGHPRVLALTATAPEDVQQEIVARLGMRRPKIVLGDLDRPNIRLAVRACKKPADKLTALRSELEHAEPPGIVYTATRKHAEQVADALGELGIDADVYHAGLKKQVRDEVQSRFMAGELPIIVATSAFGMAVDKPNVRFVHHFDVPGSLAAYYQEMGRAGRDGEPARAVLLYRPQDLALHKFFAGGARLQADDVEAVAAALHARGEADLPALREAAGLPARRVAQAVVELEQQGLAVLTDAGAYRAAAGLNDLAPAVEAMQRRQQAHRTRLALDLERMRAYAELRDCRRRYVLEYFGQAAQPCGNCDNCERGLPAASAETPERPFPAKTRVRHRKLGLGIVLGYAGARVRILFDDAGEKTLDLKFAEKRGLLERA